MAENEFNFEQAAAERKAAIREGIKTLWRIVQTWEEERQSHPSNQQEIDNDPRFEINQAILSILALRVEDEDESIWDVAELAALAGKRYGSDYLKTLAHEVNLSANTLQQRRQQMVYFGRDLIDKYRDTPLISFRHFRVAMRVGTHHEDLRQAIKFLDDCLEFDWHVGQAEVEADKRIGKPITPQKIAETRFKVLAVKGGTVTLEFENVDAAQALDAARKAKSRLNLKLFNLDVQETITQTPLPTAGATVPEVEQAATGSRYADTLDDRELDADELQARADNNGMIENWDEDDGEPSAEHAENANVLTEA